MFCKITRRKHTRIYKRLSRKLKGLSFLERLGLVKEGKGRAIIRREKEEEAGTIGGEKEGSDPAGDEWTASRRRPWVRFEH